MRIFISYGHDCSSFVDRVRTDLEAIGHEVWIDNTQISYGDDWRSVITDGITNSQAVLIFLSAHSLRKNGVCLDEISIAVACGRHIIRPILMEQGITDLIPPAIASIKFYDFSDWKNHVSIEQDSWYSNRFQQLASDLEKIDDRQFERQMTAIQNMLHPIIFRNMFIREIKKPYHSRGWIENKLKEWMDRVGNDPLVMVGFPGSGKSCFCTHYFQRHPYVVSLIYCEWGKQTYNDLSQIIRNIAYQISTRITSYRKRLLWILNTNQLSIQSLSASELFEALLVEPLSFEINNYHEPLVIVIDGVDEVSTGEQNTLARLLAENQQKLPDFVHLLITTRYDASVTRFFPGAEQLIIKPNDKNVSEDIIAFVQQQLAPCIESYSEKQFSQLVERISEACSGSFLLANLIVSGIQYGKIKIDSSHLIPNSISSTYLQWMSRIVTGKEFETHYYDAFSILASSNEPIPVNLFKKALGWRKPQMANFIRTFGNFIVEEDDLFSNHAITLFHPSFRRWLSNEEELADVYSVSKEDGYSLLADAVWEEYSNGTLDYSNLLRLKKYLENASRKKQLQEVMNDDNILERLIELAQDCISQAPLFQNALNALDQAEQIFLKRSALSNRAKIIKQAEIPIIKASALFVSGDYNGVKDLLSESLDDLISSGGSERYMSAMYMLGTACDMLGDREKSVEYFQKLRDKSKEERNDSFLIRAITGLAWNNHFTNMQEGQISYDLIASLQPQTNEENVLCQLVHARLLLSEGHLNHALKLFMDTLQLAEDTIWGYDPLACRNQMLLIEAIVACFDSDEYELGIRSGLSIYQRLSGRGSLAECYCASWLSMNYLMDGQTAQANDYLCIAEKLNSTTNNSPHSQWINMHLLSIRAFFFAETDQMEEALALHEKVSILAEQCSDTWVLGDALYEQILISYKHPDLFHRDMKELVEKLEELAKSSQLPHLLYKAHLARVLLDEIGADESFIQETLYMAHGQKLPSIDIVESLYLCLITSSRQASKADRENLQRAIVEKIDEIEKKNPNGRYAKRNKVQQIIQEVKHEL